MAGVPGSDPYDDPSLKGLSRIFSSRTLRGRANVAKVTLGTLTLIFIYKKLT